MFTKECEMTPVAAAWLKDSGHIVRQEFIVPHGYVDLVGLRFNPENVQRRLALKQKTAIGSVFGTRLLLSIPDVEEGISITLKALVKPCSDICSETKVAQQVEKLMKGRFVVPKGKARYQRVNGWLPLHDSLVAIELKLLRIQEVLCQARSNLTFADESYAGLPMDVANRVYAKRERWAEYFDTGVGLLGVSSRKCSVLIPSRKNLDRLSLALQTYCVEKYWRKATKGEGTAA